MGAGQLRRRGQDVQQLIAVRSRTGLIEQLIVEIRVGEASPSVTRIPEPPAPLALTTPLVPWRGVIMAVIATAAAILAAVLSR